MASISFSPLAPAGFQPFDSLVPVWELFGYVAAWTARYPNPLDRRARLEHEVTWFVHDASKWRADILEMFPRIRQYDVGEHGGGLIVAAATIDDDDAAVIANQLAMDAFWAARPGQPE